MQEIIFNHKPVLFEETIESLGIQPEGTYIDGTAGGGGHSGAILERLTTGKLLSIDRDPDAIAVVRARLSKYPGSIVAMGNFSEMDRIAAENGIFAADGVLLDIGVSSFQLDTAERGFSYHSDAPLDMRMSKSGTSAADLVNTLSWQQLAEIISRYGEDKSAARIAKGIAAARERKPIETTAELAEIVRESVPAAVRRAEGHPARRTFQAHRRQRRARCAEKRPCSGLWAFKTRRPAGGHHVPFARGPHRQAADERVVHGLHLPEGFSGLRVRQKAAGPAALQKRARAE